MAFLLMFRGTWPRDAKEEGSRSEMLLQEYGAGTGAEGAGATAC